jgi:large subunit ribosomal protein L29
MTSKEIRDLTSEEITTKLRESRANLLDKRIRRQTGQVEKTHEIRALRKEVARMETILRQKAKAPAAAS